MTPDEFSPNNIQHTRVLVQHNFIIINKILEEEAEEEEEEEEENEKKNVGKDGGGRSKEKQQMSNKCLVYRSIYEHSTPFICLSNAPSVQLSVRLCVGQ